MKMAIVSTFLVVIAVNVIWDLLLQRMKGHVLVSTNSYDWKLHVCNFLYLTKCTYRYINTQACTDISYNSSCTCIYKTFQVIMYRKKSIKFYHRPDVYFVWSIYSDINECDMFPNLCVNGRCENVFGMFRCACNQGYKLDATGGNCTGWLL